MQNKGKQSILFNTMRRMLKNNHKLRHTIEIAAHPFIHQREDNLKAKI